MTINILSSSTINKIAAGEVIDRPFSVIKELVENSIDAKADEIIIELQRGGRNYISVTDNGCGIDKNEVDLAFTRHATSKLTEEKIEDIQYLGFRGEALSSIASVSNVNLKSLVKSSSEAYEIELQAGTKLFTKPCSFTQGTQIIVKDLFFTTPNRLKFLKSESSETSACLDLVKKLSITHEKISFKVIANNKEVFYCPKHQDKKERISYVIGKEFLDNSLHFSNEEKASVKIYGYASIPTYNFSTFFHQNIFVNKRIIKDKLISASVRIAYRNLMASNRYPAIILFIEIGNTDVDVNVHPTKSEVRFKDPNQLKSLIINTIRSGITNTPLRTSTKITKEAALLFKPSQTLNSIPSTISSKNKQHSLTITGVNSHAFKESEFKISETFQKQTPSKNIFALDDSRVDKYQHQTKKNYTKHEENPSPPQNHEIGLLGHAKCQINKTYIISQSEDGLILVDQHAAHERITLHNIKQELKNGSVKSQILLIPEVMELSDSLIENLLEKKGNLLKFGIEIERNGKNQIAVRRIPAIMGNANPRSLIETIAENIYVFNDVDLLESKIDEIWGNIACHFSIRSGKILTLEEMDSLLREMEKTPLTSQCNHGRPTFVKLSFNDIEKIFERI